MILPLGDYPAKIMIVGEAPSREDINRGQAFSGSAGFELSQLLAEVGIPLNTCFCTHVVKDYPPKGDPLALFPRAKREVNDSHVIYRDRWVHKSVPQSISTLMAEIRMCQPNIILALGEVALWALTGKKGIGDWRGSELVSDLMEVKVIPTYAPSSLFKQFSLRPIILQDLRRMVRESTTAEIPRSNYSVIIPSNIGEAMTHLNNHLHQADIAPLKLACDIETRNFHIACLGYATTKRDAFVFPFMTVRSPYSYWTLDEEVMIVDALRRLLTHPNVEVVGQNFIYDTQHIHRSWHFIPRFRRDTMLAHHVCFPGTLKSLDYISSLYCEHYTFWKNDSKDWDPKLGERQLWNYNGEDCCRTYECDTALQQIVDSLGLREQHDFQQSMFYPVLRTMIRGVRYDTDRQQILIKELTAAKIETQAFLDNVIGRKVNFGSPKQIAELFYQDLAQREIINKKTNKVTTNEEALVKLAERQILLKPIIDKILELRSIQLYLSTFLGEGKGQYHTGLLDIDNRIRCSFNIAGTKTFRFSSDHNAFGTGLNFQNLSKGDE